MRDRVCSLAGIVSLVLLAGCFHATVYTGLPGAGEKVSQPWAHGFLFGLVAPSPVESANRCRGGVYKVETVHTFSNMLATLVTAGIYSPIRIDVTCVLIPRVSSFFDPNESSQGIANCATPRERGLRSSRRRWASWFCA